MMYPCPFFHMHISDATRDSRRSRSLGRHHEIFVLSSGASHTADWQAGVRTHDCPHVRRNAKKCLDGSSTIVRLNRSRQCSRDVQQINICGAAVAATDRVVVREDHRVLASRSED